MSKKEIIKTLFFLILTLILIILINSFYLVFLNKKNIDNYILSTAPELYNNSFSVNSITFFSSCNASSKVNSNSSITLENLYQFTDIAIFIDNNSDIIGTNSRNTLKEIYIDNISFDTNPSLGKPALYKQVLNNFATGEFIKTDLISSQRVDFSVSSKDNIDYSSTEFQNNCSKPITLCYVNSDIIDNYTISNAEVLTYDGSLLDICNVPVNKLNCSISFDIYIVNNLDEKFICPIYFEIPLHSETNSIQDGKYVIENKQNFIFYRI